MNTYEVDFNNNTELEKKEWHIKDVIFAIVIFLSIHVFLNIIFNYISLLHIELNGNISITIAAIFTIYILSEKYPLRLLLLPDYQNIFKYSIPAFILCFLIYLPFYHHIWFDQLIEVPEHLKYFKEYNSFEKVIFLFDFCFFGPVTEEILNRGFFYRIIRNRYNVFWGTIISTTIFYLLHGLGPFNLNIILGSLIFTYVYEKSGNIWTSIITHSLNNISWFVLVFLGLQYRC